MCSFFFLAIAGLSRQNSWGREEGRVGRWLGYVWGGRSGSRLISDRKKWRKLFFKFQGFGRTCNSFIIIAGLCVWVVLLLECSQPS